MSQHSDATRRFLLAAKHAEIKALKQLTSNCRVVTSVSELIHQLQRERGMSNIYLASKAQRFQNQRAEQIHNSQQSEELLRSLLNAQYLIGHESADNMRLLNSITVALQGIDHLSLLRMQVGDCKVDALASSQAYCRLIAGLLSVVFEAADVAGDPVITRLLVALFNFIQAKEYAGQERAWGAIGFAETHFDSTLCQRLEQLQQAQEHCFSNFEEFANQAERNLWQQVQQHPSTRSLVQMRSMIQQLADGSPIAAEISEVWYELATQRIDEMHQIEEQLAERLLKVANQRVKEAEEELYNHKKQLKLLAAIEQPLDSSLSMLFDPSLPGLQGIDVQNSVSVSQTDKLALHRSFYDLLRGQSERIKHMADELNEAKRAITEQKRIDRAKLLLMQQLSMSEADAYRTLQKRAMDEKVRIADMAEQVIKACPPGATKLRA